MRRLEQFRRAGAGRDPANEPGGGADTRERWGRVKALFLEALEHPDSERSAFLARVAADDADLLDEVESLLATDSAEPSFGETPAAALLGTAVAPDLDAVRLPPGTRLGPYEILSFIAAGGMGAVYRARHTLLGREVAIKTVSGGFADDAARRRLIREARHASKLTHPNICAIYDVGEVDDVPFIVMEYVPGRALGKILHEGVPDVHDALVYGIQIASALAHAHQHGIIHRDLKSANVVIDVDGRAIVLDFGLARRVPSPDEAHTGEQTLTLPNALAGTLSHMAPEVLRGNTPDVRSDVWSLGVLLYELASGGLPFTGRTPFETSSAILGEPPRPIGARVPLAFRLVIERCLNKDPERRYQHAREVGAGLDAIRRRRAWPLVGRLLVSARRRTLYAAATAAVLLPLLIAAGRQLGTKLSAGTAGRVSTVALLPLENATGNADAAYYADGITDALIAQLGAATDVRVLSRGSTERAARGRATIAEVGAQLGADVVVRSALQRADDRIALDVSLVRASNGRVVWSERYQRSAREILALEADVVRGLANGIQLTLRPGARERLAAIRAVSPDVYEAYLKGRYEWSKRTRSSLELAIQHFTRAVELDPTYAPAHAALADCFNQLGTVMLGGGSPREYRPRAADEAIKALQIDPNSAEAHAALGYVWHYDWRWADAERELRRAIDLNPSYPLARIWYANLLMSRRRMNEAIEQVYAARDLDPFSLIVNTNVGWVLDRAGRYDDAIAQLTRTLALDSQYVQARWRLAGILATVGRFEEARDHMRRVVALTDSAPAVLASLAAVEGRAGSRSLARSLLGQIEARSRREYIPSGLVAQAFDAVGDRQNALTWLERAFAERSNAIAYLLVDYQGSPIRAEPRFQAMLADAGLR